MRSAEGWNTPFSMRLGVLLKAMPVWLRRLVLSCWFRFRHVGYEGRLGDSWRFSLPVLFEALVSPFLTSDRHSYCEASCKMRYLLLVSLLGLRVGMLLCVVVLDLT